MTKRLASWVIAWLVALDQIAYVWLAGWPYVWLGRGDCPNPDGTISGSVGRAALKGERWALVAQHIIDAMLGEGHCRRTAEREELCR